MFWTFFKAWARVQWVKVRGYEFLAPAHIAKLRYEDGCRPCPFFNGAECEVCHCLVEAKVMISTEKCPIGTWGARWVKKGATTD